jgi:hypothetical protein
VARWLDAGRRALYPYDLHGMYDVLCAAARKLADLAGLTDADLRSSGTPT